MSGAGSGPASGEADRPWPVLAGPTASGKTAVALALAERLGAEIVSVDSRQVYRGLEIGSAAPTAAERARVPHHLVGVVEPGQVMTAGEFGRLAREAAGEIAARGRTPLLVGGSGLYLRAALGGLDDDLPRDPAVRDRLRARIAAEGAAALHRELAGRDPDTAARVSPRDAQRITRALELIALTGRPASALRTRGRSTQVAARVVVLSRDNEDLEARIRDRTAAMIAAGLAREVRALLALALPADTPVLRSVGYAETVALFEGRLREAVWPEAIAVNTRRFAKRQRTWFRGLAGATWIAAARAEPPERTAERILEALAGPPAGG